MNNQISDYVNNKRWPFIGLFFYYIIPYRKKIILENMRRVFKDTLNNRQIKKLCCLFYKNLLTVLLDSLKFIFYSREKIKRHGKVIGLQYLEEALTKNKGALIFTGHFGSWEFGTVASLLNSNKKYYFIRKEIKNKWIERYLFTNFRKNNLEVIAKNKKSLLKIYRLLQKRKCIILVLDQHASIIKGDGIMIEFFGEKCGTYKSLAALAQKFKIPVVPAYSYRDDNNQYIGEFSPALPWQTCEDKEEEIYQNTLIYNQCLEKMLLRHPEQWLWSHRRWKGRK